MKLKDLLPATLFTLLWSYPFLNPEAPLTLVSTKKRDLWPDLIFWAHVVSYLNQSDLSDLTESAWIADFRCWSSPLPNIIGPQTPEVAIYAADQKECGFWGPEGALPRSPGLPQWLECRSGEDLRRFVFPHNHKTSRSLVLASHRQGKWRMISNLLQIQVHWCSVNTLTQGCSLL